MLSSILQRNSVRLVLARFRAREARKARYQCSIWSMFFSSPDFEELGAQTKNSTSYLETVDTEHFF